MIILFLLPTVLMAQEYTIFREQETSIESEGANTILIVPFQSKYIISEVDRMLCDEAMGPRELRSKLRQKTAMEVTKALGDSLDALDLSIPGEQTIDIIDYVYNSLDYRYVKLQQDEPQKKRRININLPKKKENKTYGAYSKRQDGQLDRIEVHHDRYMSATFGNPGAVDYLQDIHSFDYILVLTQFEIRRNLDAEVEQSYQADLHYELMDSSGEPLRGAKETVYLTNAQMDINTMKEDVLPGLADALLVKSWASMHSTEEVTETPAKESFRDNHDY